MDSFLSKEIFSIGSWLEVVLASNVNGLEGSKLLSCCTMFFSNIWLVRKKFIFENVEPSPALAIESFFRYLSEFLEIYSADF